MKITHFVDQKCLGCCLCPGLEVKGMELVEVHCLKTKSEWSFINTLQLYLIRTVDIHSKYSCTGTERVNT